MGYVRVSTAEQADSGAGLMARCAITVACEAREWPLVAECEDSGASGSSMKRCGLRKALDAVESRPGAALVVAKLDRLSRSIVDFAHLMERSRREGWPLVALELGVDTSTPQGETMANVMASFAQ